MNQSLQLRLARYGSIFWTRTSILVKCYLQSNLADEFLFFGKRIIECMAITCWDLVLYRCIEGALSVEKM